MTINKELAQKCNILGERIMFIGVPDAAHYLNILGLEYRKNKTIEDLREAVKKGVCAGNAKTEHELSMIELYLCYVLKLKRVPK